MSINSTIDLVIKEGVIDLLFDSEENIDESYNRCMADVILMN